MNRRKFFSFLGIGSAAAVVAPTLLAKAAMKPKFDKVVSARINVPSPSIYGAVYEDPCEGCDYSIGVYAGHGLSQLDPSCVSIMRKGERDEPDVQVAEFLYGRMSLGDLSLAVADWAKRYGKKCKDIRGPLIVIEQVAAPGDVVQALLKIMGFTRFYHTTQHDPSKIQMIREGWYSNKTTVPILMDRFVEAVNMEWYKSNSDDLKRILEKPEKEQRYNPCFMAAAQSYVAMHEQ